MFRLRKKKGAHDYTTIVETDPPFSWTVEAVLWWLENRCDVTEKSVLKMFEKEKINGSALIALTEDDLRTLKVNKLGIRKRILNKITAFVDDEERNSVSSSSHNSESSESISHAGANTVVVQVRGIGEPFELLFRTTASVRFRKLNRKLSKRFDYPVNITFQGQLIEDEREWRELWKKFSALTGTVIEIAKQSPNFITKVERQMLDGLVDAALCADTDMNILFANKAASLLTGYTVDELQGMHVTNLMRKDVAQIHQKYVDNYIKTREARVIGIGRCVEMVQKNSSVKPCWLAVTEQKRVNGRHTFTGTLHEMSSADRGSAFAQFAVLDAFIKAAIIIDAHGGIKFLNGRAEKMFGVTSADLSAKNISLLMPEPYSSQHNHFLSNYIRSGRPKVIGTGGRNVLAKRADGSIFPIELAVSELWIGGERHFLGIAKPVVQEVTRSLLQDVRGVVNDLMVASLVVDCNGTIQAFNDAACAALGHTIASVLGKPTSVVFPDNDLIDDNKLGRTCSITVKLGSGQTEKVPICATKTEEGSDYVYTVVVTRDVQDEEEHGISLQSLSNLDDINTASRVKAFKEVGFHEDANKQHRPSMEDAWVVVDDFVADGSAFVGVYDGHGGEQAAHYSARNLHHFLQASLQEGAQTRDAFVSAFRSTHDQLGTELGKSGCTAIGCYYDASSKTLHCANVGDTRAVYCPGDGSAVRLSHDHKVTDDEERKRIESVGGMIINGRISGILAVARSLGDYRAEKYLSRVPFYINQKIAPGSSLIVACDGLWDVCSDKEAAAILKSTKGSAKALAKLLVKYAIDHKSTDNVTVIVIRF